MIRRDLAALLLLLAIVGSALGCSRREGDEVKGGRDTLMIQVPANVDERLEQGARKVGGKVGEALEETGEAIEKTGERLREKSGQPAAGDTL